MFCYITTVARKCETYHARKSWKWGHVKKWGAGEEMGLSVQSVDYHVLKADFLLRDQYFQNVFESRELALWNLG